MRHICIFCNTVVFSALLIALPVFSAEVIYATNDAVAVAEAKPLHNNKRGYLELYLDDPLADVVRAQYQSLNGDLIADKRLKFSNDNSVPSFELIDHRISRGYRVLPLQGRALIQSLHVLDNNIRAVVDVREVAVVEPMVVDAQFHRYLVERWADISAGKTLRFNFLQLDRARLVPMLVKRKTGSGCRRDQLCVEVTLKNIWLRFLVKPVRLTYDVNTRRLLRYSGMGPLMTESGDGLSVDLNYRYQ